MNACLPTDGWYAARPLHRLPMRRARWTESRARGIPLRSAVFAVSGRGAACKVQSTSIVNEKAKRTQSNLSVQRRLQPVPPQVHFSKTLCKFCPFIPLAFHITSAHLQEWLVNKIYRRLFKVHFHHIFLEREGRKKKNVKKSVWHFNPISSNDASRQSHGTFTTFSETWPKTFFWERPGCRNNSQFLPFYICVAISIHWSFCRKSLSLRG